MVKEPELYVQLGREHISRRLPGKFWSSAVTRIMILGKLSRDSLKLAKCLSENKLVSDHTERQAVDFKGTAVVR